jgi:cytochrome c oxidase subunit 1
MASITTEEIKSLAPIQHRERAPATGLVDWLTTVDHKKIGVLYAVSALIFLVVGGFEALLMRLQLFVPENEFLSGETFNGLVTMHATTMVFLSVMPLSAAFANYFIPLQIGARDVAFPRLNAFSYWTFLVGALILNASFLFGAPSAGWFGYAPLTARDFSGIGVDFWSIGLTALAISSMIAGTNFIVTVLNLRAPGMTLMRVPVLSWMLFIIQFLLAFSFPPIAVGLILLTFDRTFGTVFYATSMGGDPQLWQHLFWLFGHPEVYVLILPAMGLVSEILPVFSRKPLFGQSFVVFSGVFIGFVGFGVWAHHMFTAGMGPLADAAFATTTAIIAVPTGVKIFNWLATIWGGRLEFTMPMVWALAFIPLFTIGGLSGIMLANPPLDLQVHDSYFVVAHFHYVLVGGSIIGLFAGLYFYFPKITGYFLDHKLGWAHFILFVAGLNITFFPMHMLGQQGMPRRIYTYYADAGWNLYNGIATLGVLLMAAGTAVFAYNVIISLKQGQRAGNDPWDANTLEWLTESPPREFNFSFTPQVRSDRPLWDHKHNPDPKMRIVPPSTPEEFHMPSGSWKPMIATGAVTMILLGVLLSNFFGPATFALAAIGAVGTIVSIWMWINEPV